MTVALALATAVVLAGCGRARQTPDAQAVLRYPLTIEPATLDPALTDAGDTLELLQNVYEGLVTFDENTQIVPCVAERWETSADGRTITFHLNPKARFHRPFARPVTASDIKYSLERVFWPETRAPLLPNTFTDIVGAKEMTAGKRRDLEGAKVLDPQTISITLTHPCGYYPLELAAPFIVCREAIEKNGGKIGEKAAIGTGPFILKEYHPNRNVVLEANPDYYGGRPKLDRIERPVVLDNQTAHIKYEMGELDICRPSETDFVNDQKIPGMNGEPRLLPAAIVEYLALHSRLQPAFKDIRVRRALAMAIDKDEIVRVAYHSLTKRADGFLPPGVRGYNPSIRKCPYDPPGARKLLEAAGFANGTGFPKLTLVYQQKLPSAEAAVQIVRDNLKQNLGIDIDLQAREAATFFADIDKDAIPFYFVLWGSIDPHDNLTLLMRTGAKYNTIGYSDPRFDALCDQADSELDPMKRALLYQQADQIALDDVAVISLDYQGVPLLIKPYVRDAGHNLGGLMPHYKTRIQR